MHLPLSLTFYITKTIQYTVTKLGKGGGMALPGLLAEKANPKLLSRLTQDLTQGVIVVAGTNGKTTTSRLIASLLEGGGYQVVHNRSGSNMYRGLLSTFIAKADGKMKVQADWAVLEVDEASLPQVISVVQPQYVVALNLFRDQLDRYGEISTLAKKWQQACQRLPASAKLVINVDDPLVNYLAQDITAEVIGFSLKSSSPAAEVAQHADSRRCPKCGQALEFSAVNYSHLGQYHCPTGDYQPIQPQVVADAVQLDGLAGSNFQIHYQAQTIDMSLKLAGLYNVYNALAANAIGLCLGIPSEVLQQRTINFQAVFGRLEQVKIGQTTMTLILVKNPTGFNQVLQTLSQQPQAGNFWFIINDMVADGRDVSWLWDVQFSTIIPQLERAIVSGSRWADVQICLKYQQLDQDKVSSTKSLADGLRQVSASKPEHLYCLCNYTAMIELRRLLHKQRIIASKSGE